MAFTTDKQTLDDLNIIGRNGSDSVFTIFNHTLTRGGADLLEEMFRNPLPDRKTIQQRTRTIKFFCSHNIAYPFKAELFDTLEQYLESTDERSMLTKGNDTLSRKISGMIAGDTEFKVILSGIAATIQILQGVKKLLLLFHESGADHLIQSGLLNLDDVWDDPELIALMEVKTPLKLSFDQVAAHDQVVRFKRRQKMRRIIRQVYLLDAYVTVATVARKHNFVFPELLPEDQHALLMDGVYHPQVKNAIANKLDITSANNIVFLTGANMAGKSTFMKTLGIALYLAHMGFPVAAAKMSFSFFDGIYTTINLPDDLSSGNSHFYAEVLRIKKIAKELKSGKKLFVIFDELFRGTNVKDAYEGTVAITKAFAAKPDSIFIVSTHIIEAGEELKTCCPNISFVYMPTRMQENNPVYSYKLETGITSDRHGMVIINNERILEIIRSRKTKPALG